MFIESPRFPTCPSFGYTSEPMYSVTHIETAGGQEQSNENWSQALHRYTVSFSRALDELAEAYDFYNAVGGTADRFRFKDFADYKSCRIHLDPTDIDQPIVVIDGAKQLVKRYYAGSNYKERLIQKPVQGTILLAENGTLKSEGGDYTIDYATGIVTSALAGTLTWGGEFDVPCRFDSEFPIQIITNRVHSAQVVIKEVRDIS